MKKSQIQEMIKKIEKTDGLFLHPISNFFDGGSYSRNKKGKIKMNLTFDAKQLCVDECEGIPLKYSDFKLVPFLLFVDWHKIQRQKNKGVQND